MRKASRPECFALFRRRAWEPRRIRVDALVLIAGGPGVSHTYFHPFFSGLADASRVIYFDAFESGRSDRAKSVREYTFDREVDNVEALRKALKLERISVFGHSYGGMVAQAYAVKHPNAVSSLILCDAPHSAEAWQAGNDVVNAEIRKSISPKCGNKCSSFDGKLSRLLKGASRCLQSVPPTLYMFHHPANPAKPVFEFNSDVSCQIGGDDVDFIVGGDLGRFDVRRALTTLQVPILILTGRFDRAVPPRLAAEYKHFLPNAQFVTFEESGHAPFVEETSKFVEAVKTFLRK